MASPSDLPIDKNLLDVIVKANDEITREFFDALDKHNINKSQFLANKIRPLQDYITSQYDKWIQYRMPYEYINGVSQVQAKIDNFLK